MGFYPKTFVTKFCFSEFKTEKVKFITQNPTKIACISVFNVGACLGSCLSFRPFYTLDLSNLVAYEKKNSQSS